MKKRNSITKDGVEEGKKLIKNVVRYIRLILERC